MGEWCLRNLERGGFNGKIYPVNPSHSEVAGLPCYASLNALPETPQLVIFAVSDQRVEAALDDAIEIGVPAAVIMSTLVVDDDAAPSLKQSVTEKVAAAGMLVCGANGMGFYNVRDQVWACGFDSAEHAMGGNVAIVSHSGSGMSGIIDCEERLRINFAVSTGNEISVAMDEYLDFVLDLPETAVVGLFVETARNPAGFRAALKKAAQKRIPIIALKVGRTEESARLCVSHSGAMAGDDATYDALFDRYGVQRVRDQDEWTTALILFAQLHPVGAGGLVTLHDSGGERQLMVDLADEAGVPLTTLQPATVDALEDVLDPELPAINPLDGWSRGGPNAAETMSRSLTLMLQDEGAAMAAVVHDRAPYGLVYPGYLNYMQRAHADSGKPVALVSARQGTGSDAAVITSTHAGYPVLDGVRSFLTGVRALFAYRDFLLREQDECPAPAAGIVDRWASRLATADTLSEAESLELLDDFGLQVATTVRADSEASVVAAASAVTYPLVLKTAKDGLLHKSEQDGVIVSIANEEQLRRAYAALNARLGPEVLVAAMVTGNVEMLLGVKRDPQFGPVVLFGFGGVLAETINDVVFALPPFDSNYARRCVDGLRLRPMLDGLRGAPAADIVAVCETAARFSSVVHALRDVLMEVDVNPLIVSESGATAVDALIVGRDRRGD